MSRQIDRTEVGYMTVSTVKLPVPLPGIPYETACWYETMIFGGKKHGYTRRCETLEQAKEQHQKVIQYAKDYLKSS